MDARELDFPGLYADFHEHGINGVRAAVLLSLNPALYKASWEAVARMDPGLLEASKYGLNLRSRPDYPKMAKSISKIAQVASNVPVLGKLGQLGGGLDALQ